MAGEGEVLITDFLVEKGVIKEEEGMHGSEILLDQKGEDNDKTHTTHTRTTHRKSI